MLNEVVAKRSKPSLMRWFFACLALVFIGWMIVQWFRPTPPIRVSPQTTFLTQPIGSDGLPDYRLAKKLRQGKGITVDENAATFFWQAMGRGDWEPAAWDALSKELAVQLPSGKDGLESLHQAMSVAIGGWINSNYPTKTASFQNDWEELVSRCQEAPWKGDECPPLVELIDRHESYIDLLYQASNRAVFYSPSMEALIHNDEMDLDFQLVQSLRNMVRALSLRACLRMGDGDLDGAWADLRTAVQLTWLPKPESWISLLVQIACESVVHDRVKYLLADSRISPSLAEDIFLTFEKLPDPLDQLRDAARGERLFSLAWIILARNNPVKSLSSDWSKMRSEWLLHGAVDWNVSLEKTNAFFDQLDSILLISEAGVRHRQLDSLAAQINQNFQMIDSRWIQSIGFLDPSKRSQIVADDLIGSGASSSFSVTMIAEYCSMTRYLTTVAAKLAVHRATNGSYPVALNELALQTVTATPVDPIYGSSIQYRRLSETSLLLHALGPNGRDDEGSDYLRSVYRGLSLPTWPAEMEQAALNQLLIENGELVATDIQPDPLTMIAADADDISWRTPTSQESFSDLVTRILANAEDASVGND